MAKRFRKPRCRYCGTATLVKAGRKPTGTGSWYQKYKCKKCGRVSTTFK